eukprot:3964595-Amphidinium_carterae.1
MMMNWKDPSLDSEPPKAPFQRCPTDWNHCEIAYCRLRLWLKLCVQNLRMSSSRNDDKPR